MLYGLWLLWAATTSAALYAAGRACLQARSGWRLLAIAMVALALRGAFASDHFYGLEYEDAFVYAVAARDLGTQYTNPTSPSVSVCAVGSIEHCIQKDDFPGHLLGFPALLNG